ncbi:MAG: ATP-binding protein [bacterium]|nr:ATP-binding protein [bacterium]
MDLLIHREVRRWQMANQNAADLLRGQYISDAEVDALLKQPFGTHWRHMVAPPPNGEAEAYARTLAKTDHQIESMLTQQNGSGEIPRLAYLAQAFNLSQFELDTLLIGVAPALDLRYERLYGYLLDDATRKRPSINLVLDLLCKPGPDRLLNLADFSDEAPLFKLGFLKKVVEPGMPHAPILNQALAPDPSFVAWLMGQYEPHPDLGKFAQLDNAPITTEDILTAGDRLHQIESSEAEWPLFLFAGADRAAQVASARLLAHQVKRPLLKINMRGLVAQELTPATALRLALRDALLTRAIPYLHGWDVCLKDRATPTPLLRQLMQHPDLVIVVSELPWQARAGDRERPLLRLDFPMPNYNQRIALWHQFLQTDEQTAAALKLEKLAGQFTLRTGQIRDVVATARDTAIQYGRDLNTDDLFAAARAHSNPGLSDLARKITPRYDWADLVLPDDPTTILREIVSTVEGRALVLEGWGVGKKLATAGVTVLFAGSPGTGKTMAAEVIARELGLDMFKIDLSGVVSKYIGETEKNLERIFNEAQSSNAILFFDEADSIFGKRSEVKDAHDRYANIEVSYLLQRMESYDGVTILATNLRANLDEAFTRRLQFAVDFPFPEWKDRLRIWKTLFPTTVPCDDNLDFERMARRFKLAGGNIRNIIVSAAYLAATNGQIVTMEHILHGTRRELQKMGRLVDLDDLKVER